MYYCCPPFNLVIASASIDNRNFSTVAAFASIMHRYINNNKTAAYVVYPKDTRIVPYPLATLKCSHALTSCTCADFFLKLNNSLGQVVIQSNKSPHKSNSLRRETISKLPGGRHYLWVFRVPDKNPILARQIQTFS